MFDFCLIIVTVDVHMKLDFLQLLSRRIPALRLQILLLLILKFAEIHDAHHRRSRTIRYQHQIQPGLMRQLPRSRQRNHIHLFALGTDQTHLIRSEAAIIGFQQLSNSDTLLPDVGSLLCLRTGPPPARIVVSEYNTSNDLIFNLRLFAKDDNAFSAMLQRITSLPKINVPLEDPVLNCDFVIGSLKLTLAEIKSLKTGDAVIFDSEFIKSGKLNFVCEGLQAPAQYNAEKHQITLLSSLQKTDSGDDMADSEELTTIEDVELTINFSLESIKLPLSSIKELTEGSVLDLNNSALENIAVKLEGKTIGYGRIIEVGGKNALQITRI